MRKPDHTPKGHSVRAYCRDRRLRAQRVRGVEVDRLEAAIEAIESQIAEGTADVLTLLGLETELKRLQARLASRRTRRIL